MNRKTLDEYIAALRPLNRDAMLSCRSHWDSIAKPIAGLGKLEDIFVQIAGISGQAIPEIKKRSLLVFCADNGIFEEGISQTAQEVTALVSGNFAKGITCASIFARASRTRLVPIDVGIAAKETPPGVLNRKIAEGTKNFLLQDALEEEEMLQAIRIGMDFVKKEKDEGSQLILTGEMGIGNTTTSTAIASVLLDKTPDEMTGRGAGLSDAALANKVSVIKRGIENRHVMQKNPLDVLRAFGGFDIAALTGVCIGGGVYRVPIVLDGLISAAAALVAFRLSSELSGYMIPSHLGKEPAMEAIMKELSLDPILHGNFCLGEGTGALLLLSILDLARDVLSGNHTFCDIGLSPYERFDEQ